MAKITSADGTAIAYDRMGEGPPLILVGGALSTRAAAGALAGALAPHFTVYAFDRRGRGDSGDTAPYAVDREVEDVQAVIDAAGGDAHVLGFSSGAVLAIEAAARSVAMRRLAVYEPPFILDDSRPRVPRGFGRQLEALVAAGRRGDAVEKFLGEAVQMPAEALAQLRGSPMWAGMEALAHTLAYDVAVLDGKMSGDPLPAARWGAIATPTLVMAGGASPAWAQRAVQVLAAILPNAELRILEGQTHQADPAVITPPLVAFFQGAPTPAAAGRGATT